MDDVSFEDIRVLPAQLELKGNNTKTLADLVHQLQSSSIIKGLVVGTTAKSEIIFHTAIGRFISPNPLGLVRGDTITIRLAHEGEEIMGAIIKVNQEDPGIKTPINLAFIKDTQNRKSHMHNQIMDASVTEFSDALPEQLPETIRGNISYFNTSKVDKGSLLYKTLINNIDSSKDNNTIEFRVLSKSEMIGGQLQIWGDVLKERGGTNFPMIRTSFGIVTLDNVNLSKGQSLPLEIIKINDFKISSVKEQLTEFVIKLNSSDNMLRKLNTVLSFSNKGSNTYNQHPQTQSTNTASQNSLNVQQGGVNISRGDNSELIDSSAIKINNHNNLLPEQAKLDNMTAKQVSVEGKAIAINGETPSAIKITKPSEEQSTRVQNTTKINNVNSGASTNQSDNVKVLTQQGNGNAELSNKSTLMNFIGDVITSAKGVGESSKVVEGLVKAGEFASSLRIGTRKLKQNQQADYNQIEGEEASGNQKSDGRVAGAQKYQVRGINALLKDLSDMESIKRLSADLAALKEAFSTAQVMPRDPHQWASVFIPFYDAKNIYQQEVQINYPKNNMMRFLINVNFQVVGAIQLDGLIKYTQNIQNPTSFDLTVRSEDKIEPTLRRSINRIYTANQDITGIRGNLVFDNDII